MPQLIVRPAEADDLNFIYATMLKGIKHGCQFYQDVPDAEFYNSYSSVLSNLLLRPFLTPLIACSDDAIDVILGYALVEDSCLHWAYTKSGMRRLGIQKLLLANSHITHYSQKTKVSASLAKKYKWTFNPFMLLLTNKE